MEFEKYVQLSQSQNNKIIKKSFADSLQSRCLRFDIKDSLKLKNWIKFGIKKNVLS